MKKKDNKDKKGFTLAEVLITLSIIGVIAAILFPSILANYNERTLKAKRQALVSRMSQAMGEMGNQFGNYKDVTCGDSGDLTTCIDNGSALKFISEGLGSVYKISAVCDNDSLSACDIPIEITRQDGTTYSFNDIKTFGDYNEQVLFHINSMPYNTQVAGFMTKNGESILFFYNPECNGLPSSVLDFYAEGKICANMVYDLNGGKKKPNRLGEDIGIMTVLYSDSPSIVSPKIMDANKVPEYSSTTPSGSTTPIYETNFMNYANAKTACMTLGDNVGLPSREEAISMAMNWELLRDRSDMQSTNYMWTNTMANNTKLWIVKLNKSKASSEAATGLYTSYIDPTDTAKKYFVKCVYTD